MHDAFWNRVERRGPDECWLWTGRLDNKGYGEHRWQWRGKRLQMIASRYALSLHSHPAFSWMMCCHRCDNPRCCNPAHLYWGDVHSNATDRTSRNRHGRNGGKGVASSARAMVASGMSKMQVARVLGVTPAAVRSAMRNPTPRKWNRKSPPHPPCTPLDPP